MTFTDDSEGTVSNRFWDLDGDGITDSTATNPSFTYNNAGSFSPKLIVSGPAGTDTETKTNEITTFDTPVPEFSANVTSGEAPLEVTFTNLSTGNPDSFSWDFGDGDSSTSENPTHTYAQGGNFTVKLTATNVAGSATKTKSAFVKAIKSNFTGAPRTGTIPFTVDFTDLSTGTVNTRAWDFDNDGTTDSTDQNPTFEYTSAGNFTVSLTVTGTAGSDTFTKTNYVTALEAPTADFSADTTSGEAPLAVEFTDQSTGNPSSFSWNFGDGSTSTNQNPSHTFDDGGNFTVALTATNAVGSDTESKVIFIRTIKSDFTVNDSSGEAPHNVTFTSKNVAEGTITSFAWDFNNDGVTDSTVENPSFTYDNAGTFSVKLRITGPAGSSIETKTDFISVFQPPTADFTANVTTGEAPLTVTFTDQSAGNPTSFAWDFDNDGSTDSTLQNPTFTFSDGNDFDVKLTATNDADSDSETKTDFIRTIESGFTAATDPAGDDTDASANIAGTGSVADPLVVDFTADTQGTITTFAWDFNNDDIIDSTVANPADVEFPTGGNFTVSLRVTGPGGTSTEEKAAFVKVTELPVAEFVADVTRGEAPLEVSFTSQSTGNPTSFEWDFDDDGSTDSTLQNPTFTYETGGDFDVKLTVTSNAGTNTVTKTTFIRTIKSGFTATPTSGVAPLSIDFTAAAEDDVDANGFAWDFNNDGVFDTTTENPQNVEFASGGNFTITLRVTGPGGTSTEAKSGFISIFEVPVAEFTAGTTNGPAPLTVTFTDQSTGNPTSFAWDFDNDGNIDSTEQNPTATFIKGDDFDVKLTASNIAGSDDELKTDFIRTIKADFSAIPTSGTGSEQDPLLVDFTSEAEGTVTDFAWDFNNDGVINSTDESPQDVEFTTGGNFTVFLRVTGPAGTSTDIKVDFISVFEVPVSEFIANVEGGEPPLTVNFTD